MSVRYRWAPVMGALPSLHYDDADDDDMTMMTTEAPKILREIPSPWFIA